MAKTDKDQKATRPGPGRAGAAAEKTPAPAAAGTPGGARTKTPAGRRTSPAAGGNLRSEMRLFATGRPSGWDHADWLSFLDHLGTRGHDTSDPDAIGRQLERERLAVTLERVRGLGPRRIEALVNRFETLWSLRHADVDEIGRAPGMNRSLAEKVRQELLG